MKQLKPSYQSQAVTAFIIIIIQSRISFQYVNNVTSQFYTNLHEITDKSEVLNMWLLKYSVCQISRTDMAKNDFSLNTEVSFAFPSARRSGQEPSLPTPKADRW